MKTVIFSGVLLIVIVVLIVFVSIYTASNSDAISELLGELTSLVNDENWEKSEELYETIFIKWEKTKSRFAIVYHHNELEDLGVSLAYLKTYISLREKNKAIAELSVLEFGFIHLKETDKIHLENLF